MHLVLLLLGLSACKHPAPLPKTGLEGYPIPSAQLLLGDSSQFNSAQIPTGRINVLFYFRTDCPYCRAQMRDMTNHISELTNIHLYVLTLARFTDFKNFCKEFNLSNYPNITPAIDYTGSISRALQLRSVPFTAVYNPQKKLSHAFGGMVSCHQLKAVIEE